MNPSNIPESNLFTLLRQAISEGVEVRFYPFVEPTDEPNPSGQPQLIMMRVEGVEGSTARVCLLEMDAERCLGLYLDHAAHQAAMAAPASGEIPKEKD